MSWGKTLTVLAISLLCTTVTAKDIYVDANHGKDAWQGSLKKPFRTIQHAANEMVPGDICFIKAGVYRETLVPKSDQLTFRNFENDYVLITGLDEVMGWTPYKGNIWKAGFKRPAPPGSFKASMVFVNGERMNWARFPDEDGDMLNNKDMNKVNVGIDTIKFDDLPSLSKNAWQGAYFVGVAAFNRGGWFTASKGLVQESKGNSLIVTDRNGAARSPRFRGDGYGYLIGHMLALDAETEWHLQNDTLYLYPPEGTNMNTAVLEARSRILGMDLSDRSGITLEGINFKAAGVKMAESENCMLNGCTFRYASGFSAFHGNAWGDYKNGDGGIYVSGDHNTIKNCYIGKTWGYGLSMWGDHNTLENSIVEHCNWLAERLANVCSPGDDNIIRGNTIRYGARDGIDLGNGKFGLKYALRALVRYNHVHHMGMLCPDGGLFYVNHQGGDRPLANTEISYNLFHDYPTLEDPRPHGGIYLDNMSSGYQIHHNVIWNVISGVHMNDIARDNNTHDVFIYNNIMINCEYAVRMNQGKQGSINTRDVHVQNNQSNGSVFEGTRVENNRTDLSDEEFDLGAFEFIGVDWTAGASFEVPDFPDE
ncbi:MAG: right-handed parallel beta-helix repeat-containing protein [Bacteroides sp.]|nr:right-handed parallel beta-helix repeat-containing protein [Bacteroides sp.]